MNTMKATMPRHTRIITASVFIITAFLVVTEAIHAKYAVGAILIAAYGAIVWPELAEESSSEEGIV